MIERAFLLVLVDFFYLLDLDDLINLSYFFRCPDGKRKTSDWIIGPRRKRLTKRLSFKNLFHLLEIVGHSNPNRGMDKFHESDRKARMAMGALES